MAQFVRLASQDLYIIIDRYLGSILLRNLVHHSDQKVIRNDLFNTNEIMCGKQMTESGDIIEIIDKIMFVGIPEIDSHILLYLNDVMLNLICRVNKYINTLSKNHQLWNLKINKKYPGFPLCQNYRGKDLYFEIAYLKPDQLVSWATGENELGVLKYLANIQVYPCQYVANYAASNGYLEQLKWFAEYDIYPDWRGVNGAAGQGYLNVLEWLSQHKLYPDQEGANKAAENNHLEIVEYLSQIGVYPTYSGANKAVNRGHIKLLTWLLRHNIRPSPMGLHVALMNKNLDAFPLLAEYGIYPSHDLYQ
jgi:hypothetical protein